MTAAMNGRIDIDAVRTAARGRWVEILTALTSLTHDHLTGKHQPCPRPGCGGTDRFRAFDDVKETGGVFCNACHDSKNGDGFSTLQWLLGIEFIDAVRRVNEYLGYPGGGQPGSSSNGDGKEDRDPARNLKFFDFNRLQAAMFCLKKPPATVESLELCHARLALYRGKWPVIALPIFGRPEAIDEAIVGWALLPMNGGTLPVYRKGQPIEWKKTKLTSGSNKAGFIGQVDRLKDNGTTTAAAHIWKVEGLSDLLALAAQALPTDHAVITNAYGAKEDPAKLPSELLEAMAGRHVYTVHDCDKPGQDGATFVSRDDGKAPRPGWAPFIAGHAETSRNIRLPYPILPDHGYDLRDWLVAGGTLEQLTDLAEETEAATPTAATNCKPRIMLGTDEMRIVDESLAALSPGDGIYQRGGRIVHVVTSAQPPKGITRDPDAPRIVELPDVRLKELLSTAADYFVAKGEKEVTVSAPGWVAKMINARGQWPQIPAIDAVIESPIIRPDGSILSKPGFDRETGIFLRPQIEIEPVPENPTREDIDTAVLALADALDDFPFKDKFRHRAAAIAGMLTPFARFAYEGPTPLFLVDANAPGTGKGLLVDAMTFPFAGRKIARMPNGKSDEEMRKKITALALAGEPMVLIDNVAGDLGGASLDAALTATSWNDRILSETKMTGNIPLFVIWYCTVNNVAIVADTIRRSLHIRLETLEEHPEERSNFRHPDLLGWMRQHRPAIVRHCLMILRGYFAAGRPDMQLKRWGSYEGWSDVVRNAMVWANLNDPAETRQELAATADCEIQALKLLMAGWMELDPNDEGLTVNEALQKLDTDDAQVAASRMFDLRFASFRTALAMLSRDGKRPNPRSIGMKLHHLRGRIVEGKRFESKEGRLGAIWKVV